jgi:hypothetical protein
MVTETVCIRISDKTWKKFKEYCLEKYDKTHGVLGIETAQALNILMKLSPEEQAQILSNNKDAIDDLKKKNKNIFPSLKRKDRLQEDFRNHCKMNKKLSLKVVRQVIRGAGFKSESTINNYVKELVNWGYIEPLGVGEFKNLLYNPEDEDE